MFAYGHVIVIMHLFLYAGAYTRVTWFLDNVEKNLANIYICLYLGYIYSSITVFFFSSYSPNQVPCKMNESFTAPFLNLLIIILGVDV